MMCAMNIYIYIDRESTKSTNVSRIIYTFGIYHSFGEAVVVVVWRVDIVIVTYEKHTSISVQVTQANAPDEFLLFSCFLSICPPPPYHVRCLATEIFSKNTESFHNNSSSCGVRCGGGGPSSFLLLLCALSWQNVCGCSLFVLTTIVMHTHTNTQWPSFQCYFKFCGVDEAGERFFFVYVQCLCVVCMAWKLIDSSKQIALLLHTISVMKARFVVKSVACCVCRPNKSFAITLYSYICYV